MLKNKKWFLKQWKLHFIQTSNAASPPRFSASPRVLLSEGVATTENPESLDSTAFSALKNRGSQAGAEEEVSVDEQSSHSQQVTAVAFVSGSHDLKLKIVQKKRSKGIYISNSKKLKTSNLKPHLAVSGITTEAVSGITTEASSCFSSGSSSNTNTSTGNKARKPVMPSHMGHKAAAIMRILSNGSTSEVIIRQLLGDSPSTSKALRINVFTNRLLKLKTVKRFGAGGRSDPYIYTIAQLGKQMDQVSRSPCAQ